MVDAVMMTPSTPWPRLNAMPAATGSSLRPGLQVTAPKLRASGGLVGAVEQALRRQRHVAVAVTGLQLAVVGAHLQMRDGGLQNDALVACSSVRTVTFSG